MARITGIGGIFLKAGPAPRVVLSACRHFDARVWVGTQGREFERPGREVHPLWSPFPQDTTYFGDKPTDFMVNFRVRNLEATLKALRAEGVTDEDRIGDHEDGRFGWIRDPGGNRIELWEPPPPNRSGSAKVRLPSLWDAR
jgi:catechol 2,3-dioxygenase-like lactoylglutathione lyase family enzyme